MPKKSATVPSQRSADHHSGLRRVAMDVLGERAARRAARGLTFAQAIGRNTLTSSGRQNVRKLGRLRNSSEGETCVIIGNGPSLNETPLHLLKDVATFGLNRIYLMRDKLGFIPTYQVVINRLVVEQCAEDFNQMSQPLFTTVANRDLIRNRETTSFLNRIVGPYFSQNASVGVWEGATVTYVAMQLAFHMGYSKVALVGVDHRFAVSGPAHKVVESQGSDHSHFDPNYFGKGFRWQLPDLETSEVAYALARKKFEESGRSLVDCTVGGALDILPKMRLEDFLIPGQR